MSYSEPTLGDVMQELRDMRQEIKRLSVRFEELSGEFFHLSVDMKKEVSNLRWEIAQEVS